MEISIKWNVCRICLIEEKNGKGGTAGGMQCIFDNDNNLAKQIYDCTGIMVAPNDSLPEKICKKCLVILNYATNFRKTCRESDEYLQSIILQTKSTSSLFKLDRKGNESIEILEEPCSDETLSGYEDDGATNANITLDIISPETAAITANNAYEDTEVIGDAIVNEQKRRKKTRRVIKRSKKTRSLDASTDTSSQMTAKIKHSEVNDSSSCDLANVDYIITQVDEVQESIGKDDNYTEEGNVNQFFASNESVNEIQLKSDYDVDQDSKEGQEIKHKSRVTTFNAHPNYIKLPLKSEITKIEVTEVTEVAADPEIADGNTNAETADDINHLKESNEQLYILLNDIKGQNNETIVVNNDIDEEVEFIAVDDLNDEELNNIDDPSTEQVSSTVLSKEEAMIDRDNEDESNDRLSIKSYSNDNDGSIEYIDDVIIDEVKEKKFSTSTNILNKRNNQIFIKSHSMEKRQTSTNGSNTRKRSDASRKSNQFSVCDICGNHFTNRHLMSAHMRIHRQEKPHECELCFKRFITACNLQAHMRIHTGEKPYKCQYCGRRFTDRSTHLRHERTHTNEKPFACNQCPKSFSLATTLQAHIRVHTGERPYKCEPCAKSFKLPHQLKAHQNSHLHKSVERLTS